MKAIVTIFLMLSLIACGGGNYDENTNAPINNPSTGDGSGNGNNDDDNNGNTGKRKQQSIRFKVNVPETFGAGDTVYLNNLFKADSGLPLTFKLIEFAEKGICKLTGDNKDVLQTIKPGSCFITSTQAGNNEYLPSINQREFVVPPKCPKNMKPRADIDKNYTCVPNYLYIYPIQETLSGIVGQEFKLTLPGEKLYSRGKNIAAHIPHCDNIKLTFNGKFDNKIFLSCTPNKVGKSTLTISNNGKALFSSPVLFKEPKPIPPMPITKTGITTCANANENGIDCSDQSKLGAYYHASQDGEVQSGVAHDYKKITTAQGDSCIQDKATGRIWELKTDDGGLRDKDWSYHYYSTDTSVNGGQVGDLGKAEDSAECGNTLTNGLCNSQAYVQALNAANYCGYSDWRLPQLDELASLVDFGKQDNAPMIDNQVFNNVFFKQDPNFLIHGYMTDKAYALRFFNTSISSVYGQGKIRAVRHLDSLTIPSQRYEIINNGTEVKDNYTNLVWQRCALGQTWNGSTCVGKSTDLSWLDALKKSKELGNGYRLPSIKELISIAEPLRPRFLGVGFNTTIFPNSSRYFASGTPSTATFVPFQTDTIKAMVFMYEGTNVSITSYSREKIRDNLLGKTRAVRLATAAD